MATITVTAAIGSRRQSGERDVRVGDSVADVSISFDNTKIKLKSELLDACKSLIDRLGSDQLK
ncbi:MAG TPA: hypothetical protein VFA81_10675 [Burkholderiales bacterium]|nr:hypothetical protein [Burkholderiales bacterium]